MQLNGRHTVNASLSNIWEILMDPDTLARITPGIKQLENTSPNKYNVVSEIRIGPVKGAFKGDMAVTDIIENEKFTIRMNQKSKIGNVTSSATIGLIPENDNVVIDFKGEARISGLLSRTSQRLISGVAKKLTKDFFKALDKEISNL